MKKAYSHNLYSMKLLLFFVISSIAACTGQKTARSIFFATPEAGTIINAGDSVELRLTIPEGSEVDSIVYLLGDQVIGKRQADGEVYFNTKGQSLGSKLIIARAYHNGETSDFTTNIVVAASTAPEPYSFSVVNSFPHDTKAYTQGLEYHDGFIYESTGEYGKSSIRKVELTSGKVVQKLDLPASLFGEGLTMVEDKLIQLTWQENIGIVYDKNTFKKIKEFPYQESKEGWGLCFDGERLIKSDGTNRLYFLDKNSYKETGFIEVYNDKGPVDLLNELEFIDGKVYANVYQTDVIVIINPTTGAVEAELNLIGLLPQSHYRQNETNVLNGIAYDKQHKRLFVTGKNWDTLFEIKMLER